MQINNSNSLYINSLLLDSKFNFFKEGAVLEGEILEIEGEQAIIYIKDFGRIKAFIQMELTDLKGKTINFLVKSSLPNEIQLKPLLMSSRNDEIPEATQKAENYLSQILNEFEIDENPESIDYLSNLIKYNVQLNEKNIFSGIKILDKLEQLMNLDNESIARLINLKENPNFLKEDIRNLLIVTENEVESVLNLNEELEDKRNDVNQIEGIIDIDDENIALKPEANDNNARFLTALNSLKLYTNKSLEEPLGPDIVKTITLFIKYNIKPSINNLKYFLELKEDANGFLENLELFDDIEYKKFTNIDKKIMINSGGLKNIIEENYIRYNNALEKVDNYFKENLSFFNKTTIDKVEELQDKLQFLEEMNKELNFIYIPLTLDSNIYQGSVTFLKDRKKKNNPKDKINIFINLNTNTLGNVKISCEVIADIINIRFSGLNREDIELFENREKELEIAILNTGYAVGHIEYIVYSQDDFLDLLTVNKNPIYYLDVQV